jgi:hypothetical protein
MATQVDPGVEITNMGKGVAIKIQDMKIYAWIYIRTIASATVYLNGVKQTITAREPTQVYPQ